MFLKTCQGRNLNCNVTDGQRPNKELCDWSFIWNETRPVNTGFKDCASQECAKSISKCAEEDNVEARTCRWDADFCIVLKILMQILYFYASFCKVLHLFAFIFKIMQILMQSAKFHIIPQSFACAKIIKKLCTSLVQGNLYREVELYLHLNETGKPPVSRTAQGNLYREVELKYQQIGVLSRNSPTRRICLFIFKGE